MELIRREGNSMKKFLTLTALFALCLAVSAQATETRGLTMGDVNNIIKDDGNIWLYPSTINLYPDQAEAVFSDNDFAHRVGVHYQFNDDNPFVLGVYIVDAGRTLMDNKYATLPGTYFAFESGQEFSVWSNRSVNLFYGRTLGQNPFGAHLSLLQSSRDDQQTSGGVDIGQNRSFTKFMVDLGLTTSGGAVGWTLGFHLSTWKNESGPTVLSKPDGNIGAHLRVRKFHARNAKLTWVWHGEIAIDKQGVTYPDSGSLGPSHVSGVTSGTVTASDCKHFLGDVGLGLNYTVSSSAIAVLDFGVRYNKLKITDMSAGSDFENRLTDFTLPYWRVGLDGEVLSWLDVRFGATNRHSFLKDETAGFAAPNLDNNYTFKSTGTSPQMVVGTGLHFGALTIDTWMDPEFVLAGPDFIGGNSDTRDYMFMEVSAVYHFGK